MEYLIRSVVPVIERNYGKFTTGNLCTNMK